MKKDTSLKKKKTPMFAKELSYYLIDALGRVKYESQAKWILGQSFTE